MQSTKNDPPINLPIEQASALFDRLIKANADGSGRSVDPLGPEFFGPWFDRDRWADEVEFWDQVSEWIMDYQFTVDVRKILDDGFTLSCFINWEVERWTAENPGDLLDFRDLVEPYWWPDQEWPTLDGFVEAMWDRGLAYEPPRPEPRKIKVRHWAMPPEVKFHVLAEIEPRFLASYERNRPDLHNDQSGIDFSLACWAIRVGWRDQQVADLLIASRRNCRRREDRKKGQRADYVQRTIDNARAAVLKKENGR